MSFQTISVKEVVEKINNNSNGWFLPAVQRPYVWGSRYESEQYICKLFDSILNGYPIGTLIVWNAQSRVPYRDFMQDYKDGETASLVDENLWDRTDKWLVYDGQQRLQTLYSCLKYTLNYRVLVYNLLYKEDPELEVYGFEFVDKNSVLPDGYISLSALFVRNSAEKVSYRKKIKGTLNLSEDEETVFESRYDKLWSVFVGTDVKSLAYFPIEGSEWTDEKVNDVFQRLNMGGVPLSGADLMFSKIKETNPYFEERLIDISKDIKNLTNGYVFTANEILQLIFLLVKGSTKIDSGRVKADDIKQFVNIGDNIGGALKDFFRGFMADAFNINNNYIIKHLALLPIIVFCYKNYQNNVKYNKISSKNIMLIKKYFILSQLNNWNTSGIVESGIKEITDEHFPLEKFMEIARSKNRVVTISEETFENNASFSLKIMMPHRLFVRREGVSGRYKPELDHIYPMKLAGRPEDYDVNVVWNLQPVVGKTNEIKSNTHPRDFFMDPQNKSHISEYDFLPEDMNAEDWFDHKIFIKNRKFRMIKFVKDQYDIDIIS